MGPYSGLAHHCPTQAVYSQDCGKVIGQGLPFLGPCTSKEAIPAVEGAGVEVTCSQPISTSASHSFLPTYLGVSTRIMLSL